MAHCTYMQADKELRLALTTELSSIKTIVHEVECTNPAFVTPGAAEAGSQGQVGQNDGGNVTLNQRFKLGRNTKIIAQQYINQ